MKVIVLGGGVAGMSAAHELAERDFEVVVYETRAIPGGKARSMPVPGSGNAGPAGPSGRARLPLLSGLLPPPARHDAADPVRRPRATGCSAISSPPARSSSRSRAERRSSRPRTFRPLSTTSGWRFESLLAQATTLGIPAQDQAYFVNRAAGPADELRERRFAEYEHQSWWEFSGAETRSAAYGKFLADGLTRTLVAAKAREMSARTGGMILLQLLFDLARPGRQVDRVLNGPTNDVWIDPWLAHLRSLGVDYRSRASGPGDPHERRRRVTDVSIVAHGRPFDDTADFYVAAVPVEVMRLLATDEIKQAEPRLAGLHLPAHPLDERDHVLPRPRRVPGSRAQPVHRLPLGSDLDLAARSSGRASWTSSGWATDGSRGILSVDVSDWEAQGTNGKQAMYCSKRGGVRGGLGPAQAKPQRRRGRRARGCERAAAGSSTRPSSTRTRPRRHNLEPLLVNTAGSWDEPPGGDDGDREPVPGRRLRPHPHRPGHHGGGQRGRAAGGQRDPGQVGLHPAPLRGVAALRAGDLRPRAGARPRFCSPSTGRPSWR